MAETPPSHWRIWLETDDALAPVMEEVLGRFGQSVTRFEEKDPSGAARRWRVQAIADQEPDIAAIALSIAEATGSLHGDMPDFHVQDLEDVDWLALNRSQFPPIDAGRFFIHGSHFEDTPPENRIVIRLDAGPAFGSGTHETTRGCLGALDALLDEGGYETALDLGCGSGILALAFAAATGKPVLASDCDPVAARTTKSNAAANGLEALVQTAVGDGLAGEDVRARAPYDLIFANILAEPLIALAGDIAAALAPEGRLILSGLLTRQEGDVMTAYRGAGLRNRHSIVLGDWSTLVLSR